MYSTGENVCSTAGRTCYVNPADVARAAGISTNGFYDQEYAATLADDGNYYLTATRAMNG